MGLNRHLVHDHSIIADYLTSIKFCMFDVDHSLYVKKSDDGIVVIYIYVDDLIIFGDNDNCI